MARPRCWPRTHCGTAPRIGQRLALNIFIAFASESNSRALEVLGVVGLFVPRARVANGLLCRVDGLVRAALLLFWATKIRVLKSAPSI